MDALWFTQKFEHSNFFTQNLSVIVDAFFTQIFELKVRKLFLQCKYKLHVESMFLITIQHNCFTFVITHKAYTDRLHVSI